MGSKTFKSKDYIANSRNGKESRQNVQCMGSSTHNYANKILHKKTKNMYLFFKILVSSFIYLVQ